MKRELLRQQITWLQHHSLLPADLSCTDIASRWNDQFDITARLLAEWERFQNVSQLQPITRHAQRVIELLESLRSAQASLTWGIPGVDYQQLCRWVGPRLLLWPQGIPNRKAIGVISSRLSRALEMHDGWFTALRQICQGLDRQSDLLITVDKTTTHNYLVRCSTIFGLPLLHLKVARDRCTFSQWLRHQMLGRIPEDHCHASDYSALVSPPLQEPQHPTPLRDRLVAAVADQLFVLRMRSGGHTEAVVRQRLEVDLTNQRGSVVLAVGEGLVARQLADTLPTQDRVFVDDTQRPDLQNDNTPAVADDEDSNEAQGAILTLRHVSRSDYYVHCTRRASGPWPDQSLEDYQDSLLLGRADADHSALTTLARIIQQRKLLATGRAIRGKYKVVSFTAAPLDEIEKLRTYRRHRIRWDFEPYGICIERRWLVEQGAKEVRYGDETLWQQLPEADQPYFQLRVGHDGETDWAAEREWRVFGDVDLSDLTKDQALVFVPSHREALWIRQFSPWPVVVMESGHF